MVDVFDREMRETFPYNPLRQVALEIRYPPDLTILSSILPLFQKRIRHDYPLYAMEQIVTLPAGTTSNEASFQSANRERQLKLSDHHLAIIVSRYTTFDDFSRQALGVIDVLNELAGLEVVQRVGLRYINNIELRQDDLNLGTLVKPFVNLKSLPSGVVQQFVSTVNLARERHNITMTTAQLPPASPSQLVASVAWPRAIYVLDIDCYTEELKTVADLADLLPFFRYEVKRLFLDHVTDTYKQRMRGVQ